MQRLLMVLCLAMCVRAADEKAGAFAQFSSGLERLAATVAPAVVQVQVSGWCASASANGEDASVLTPCRVIGSGVIVDSSGYIITNEHVVRNARSIRVMLTPKPSRSGDALAPAGKQRDPDAVVVGANRELPGKGQVLDAAFVGAKREPLENRQALDAVIVGANREPLGKRQVLDAVVVGASHQTDLALLKIETSGLPSIPLNQTGRAPRQGQVVLAVGSPEGLDNTMTFGIVSAVGRQPSPDFPMLYIQTDAAINPGNSGGPLLDVGGELIGINTFILGGNGRNQGLGFAVPAAVVRYVYEQLRSHGVVRQSLVGVLAQTITPTLAQGLGLSRGYGIMISDVLPGSPAEDAGLRPQDIVTAVDGASVSALPYAAALMYLHDPTVPFDVTVLRGQQTLQFQVPAVEVDDQASGDFSVDPHESLISELGIFGKTVSPALALQNGLRSKTGIYVFATTAGDEHSGTGLAPGDVIASLNGVPILGMQELRTAIQALPGGQPAVVQIERHGRFLYYEPVLEQRPSESATDRGEKGDPKPESGRNGR